MDYNIKSLQGANEIIQPITQGSEPIKIQSAFNGNGYVMLLVRMRRHKIVNMLFISLEHVFFSVLDYCNVTFFWVIFFKYYISKFLFLRTRIFDY